MKIILFILLWSTASIALAMNETKTIYILRTNGPTEICHVTIVGDTENWVCS